MIMTRAHTSASILLSLMLMVISFGAVFAAGPDGLITEYPLTGSPYHVTAEGAGRVWVTLPARNAIGRLVVTTAGTSDFREFPLPTPGSHPHDIVSAAGSIWVSEYLGNKIARFDPVAETWTEYAIPTPASKPTGLTVLAGDPIQVWFCQQASDKLGLLKIPSVGVGEFFEFPLPLPWSGAQMENIAATSSSNIWFTTPGRKAIAQFSLPDWQINPARGFDFEPTTTSLYPAPTSPYDIKIDGEGNPWFTEPNTNRIGRFNPATTTSFEWYPIQTPNSGLAGIDLALGAVWFTERTAGRMGQLLKVGFAGKVREQRLPGANPAPTDIAMGSDGCAWVSASGANALVSWCAPYVRQIYLPLIQRK
jgi:streptogramin lyase